MRRQMWKFLSEILIVLMFGGVVASANTVLLKSTNSVDFTEIHFSDEYYVSLASENTVANAVLGAKPGGGVDFGEWNGTSFDVSQVGAGTYTQVISDASTDHYFYGLTPSGDLDVVYKNSVGNWDTVSGIVTGQSYTSIAADRANPQYLYGAKAGGGLDVIYYQYGHWNNGQIASGTYQEIQPDAVYSQVAYLLTSSGDIDYLYVNSTGHWDVVTGIVTGGSYSTICADGTAGLQFYTAKPVGVDCTYHGYGSWHTYEPYSDGTYVNLEEDRTKNGWFYGLTGGGDVDALYYNTGAWRKLGISDGQGWLTMEHDNLNTYEVYLSAPEPTTMALLLCGIAGLCRKRK